MQQLISHVRKGAVTKALFLDDTGDLCRLDVGRDKEGELLALLWFGNSENRGGQPTPSRDPDGRPNYKYVITIREGEIDNIEGERIMEPQMQKVISLTPTRGNKFRFMELPPENRSLDDDILDIIDQHEVF